MRFSFVGTIYAIFLAFLVVVAWQSLGDADRTVTEEGAAVLSLYRDVGALPEPARSELRGEIRAYVQTVIDDEWTAMARGAESRACGDHHRAVHSSRSPGRSAGRCSAGTTSERRYPNRSPPADGLAIERPTASAQHV